MRVIANLELESNEPGDNAKLDVEIRNDKYLILTCEDDSVGDTETGFGLACSVGLDETSAKKLLNFLKEHFS
jgi:hypothetical protein